MSFVFGVSAVLGYDFFGQWTRRIDVAADTPDAIIGDCSALPMMQPGTFAVCGTYRAVRMVVEVLQEK